jgi:hypothetical protein
MEVGFSTLTEPIYPTESFGSMRSDTVEAETTHAVLDNDAFAPKMTSSNSYDPRGQSHSFPIHQLPTSTALNSVWLGFEDEVEPYLRSCQQSAREVELANKSLKPAQPSFAGTGPVDPPYNDRQVYPIHDIDYDFKPLQITPQRSFSDPAIGSMASQYGYGSTTSSHAFFEPQSAVSAPYDIEVKASLVEPQPTHYRPAPTDRVYIDLTTREHLGMNPATPHNDHPQLRVPRSNAQLNLQDGAPMIPDYMMVDQRLPLRQQVGPDIKYMD